MNLNREYTSGYLLYEQLFMGDTTSSVFVKHFDRIEDLVRYTWVERTPSRGCEWNYACWDVKRNGWFS